MDKKELRKKNVWHSLFGSSFISISTVLVGFFLPFYLKEQGFTILQIGTLFTIGLAFGSFMVGILYSNILRRIKLRTGLILSSILAFIQTFLLFIIPTATGALSSKFTSELQKSTSRISLDVALQHNTFKNNHRKIKSYHLILETISLVGGLILSLFFVKLMGFKISFLLFACVSIFAMFFYSKVNDETRFKLKKKIKLPKISLKLKLVLFAEILYWLALGASFALVITFLVTDYFSGSMSEIAYLFIGLYVAMAATTLLTHKYLEKFNLIKTSIIGMIILFLSAVLIIISTNLYTILFAMILEGIGAGIWVPSKSAIYWKLTGKESREKVAGYLTGWRGFMGAIGPLVGGFLVVSFGILSPFYFKAIISASVILVYFYILKKH